MSLKSFLSEKLNQIDSAITNTSVIPGVNVARDIATKTNTDIDNKIVNKVTEYTNPKAIAKGGNSLAKMLANSLATYTTSAADYAGRAAVYGTAKAISNEDLAQKAVTQKTGTRELPGPIGKWVGPITPYADTQIRRKEEGQGPVEAGLKTLGTAALDSPVGVELKPVAIAGSLAFKGGKEALDPIIKKIATSKSAANITKWLGDIFQGGEKAEIDTLAKQLVSADTPELVTKTLDDAVKTKSANPIIEKAKNYSSEEEFINSFTQPDISDDVIKSLLSKQKGETVSETKVGNFIYKKHVDKFGHEITTVFDGEKPIGFLSKQKTGEVSRVGVLPEYRNKGIGSELYKQTGAISDVTALSRSGAETSARASGYESLSDLWNKTKRSSAEETTKTSRFAERVAESEKVDPFMADELNKISYNVVKNKDTIKRADDFLAGKTTDEAYKAFKSAYQLSDEGKVVVDNMTPEMNVVGIKLIDKLQAEGKMDELFDVIEQVSKSSTKKGQEIQALALFSRVTPEGIVNYAGKRLAKSGMSPDDIKKAMTPEFLDELSKMAKANKNIEAGTRQRAIADALLLKKVDDLVPTTAGHKLASAQTIAMLLNPKTMIRNVVGNAGLNAAEGVAHNVFSTPIDMLTSLVTGKRSRTFSDAASYGKGFTQGFKEGAFEGWNKIDLKKLETAYDYRNGTFKTGLMDKFERALGAGLKSTDRAFYQASHDSTMVNQLKTFAINNKIKFGSVEDLIKKVPEKTLKDMQEVAHYTGMYRTFQDPSALANSLVMIKKGLNLGKDFGMGDVVLKFPRTPANLINRGLAYSPAGFIKTIYEAAAPLIGKSKFNQKEFVESFGRALTGTTGLVGAGYLLHSLGIITGKSPESKELGQTERTTGLGQFKINVSALKRLALSLDPEEAKLQKGDVLYSYDWFQPLAIGLSVGANMSEVNKGGKIMDSVYNVIGSTGEGIDTVGDQPLFKGITQKFLYNKTMKDVLADVAQDIPASFVPTFIKQVRDLVDENQRETYSPNFFEETFNTIKNKVPGASSSLPPKVDIMGKDMQTYQDGSNNVFNVMFNPGFISRYKPTDEAKMVIDLYNETGSAGALPNSINRKVQVNGESHELTSDEYYNMKKLTGVLSQRALHKMSQDPNFTKMSPDDQAKVIASTLTDIGSASKVLLLGHKPKRLDTGTVKVLDYYMQNKEELKKMLIPPSVNK